MPRASLRYSLDTRATEPVRRHPGSRAGCASRATAGEAGRFRLRAAAHRGAVDAAVGAARADRLRGGLRPRRSASRAGARVHAVAAAWASVSRAVARTQPRAGRPEPRSRAGSELQPELPGRAAESARPRRTAVGAVSHAARCAELQPGRAADHWLGASRAAGAFVVLGVRPLERSGVGRGARLPARADRHP